MAKIKIYKLRAADLWSVSLGEPFPAKNMNVALNSIGERITGFGIYSISYDCPDFGDRIIYLGKFAGENKNGTDNALAGDVRERWFKHIGTATLLLRNLKMGSNKYYYYHKKKALKFYANDREFKDAFENSFLNLSDDILKSGVFIKGADLQVSKNRLGFAIQNLKNTNKVRPNKIEELNEILSRFTCHYWQVESNIPIKKTFINPVLQGSNAQLGAESEVIKKYRQKLPMNKEYKIGSTPHLNHYHYNPENLILVNSPEFSEYSKFIESQIKNLVLPKLQF